MEDDNSMSERILRTLESILQTDFELQEFSIIPADSNTKNKSPVLYEEHNLGLESWCVKHIYRYAYLELFEVRKQLRKKKLPFCKKRDLNHLLIGVLLINPDVGTFWNMKRELVEGDVISIRNELLFSKIVLSYKSKSNEAFAYRRWLFNGLSNLQQNDIQNLLENELSLCEMTARKNANNYHSWTHRIWFVELMKNKISDFSNFLLRELDFSQHWLSQHVSEHTGYHYRQYLINLVRKSNTNIYDFCYNYVVKIFNLVNENDHCDILTILLGKQKHRCTSLEETNSFLNFLNILLYDLFHTIEMLNRVFPNHESMWYHRRFLIFHLLKAAHEYHDLNFKSNTKLEDVALYGTNIVNVENKWLNDGEKQPKLFKTQPNKVQSSLLYQKLIESENEFIKKNRNYYQIDLAKNYEKWLKSFMCLIET